MLPDELAEEGKVWEIEFHTDFLDSLVTVAQLSADSGCRSLVNDVKW